MNKSIPITVTLNITIKLCVFSSRRIHSETRRRRRRRERKRNAPIDASDHSRPAKKGGVADTQTRLHSNQRLFERQRIYLCEAVAENAKARAHR